jgi:hypothetical protein
MSSAHPKIQVRGPRSLIAVVPHLLGFHPANSLVVVGVTGPHGRVRLAFRYDLPDPLDASVTADIAGHAVLVLRREKVTTATVIGYGAGALVTPVVDVIRHALPRAGIRLADVLRVEDGRYWSYLCTDPACCPPEGNALDPADPAVAALAGYGLTALASRDDLAATIGPVTGADADAMEQATLLAARVIARDSEEVGEDAMFDGLRRTVQGAITRYRQGGTITEPAELARLCLALRAVEVRDDAWARMAPEHCDAHLKLWTQVIRHATPLYVAAPASLLAFVAWQNGDGALATIAVERALADDPNYTMAELIGQALHAGLPPSVAVLSMTPEEVAASYKDRHQDQ